MNNRLLVICRSAWNDNNSNGNTLTNLFKGWGKDNIANLYCRAEMPVNDVCSLYYNITDSQLFKSILHPYQTAGNSFVLNDKALSKDNKQIGKDDTGNANITVDQKRERRLYSFFRIHNYSIFLLLHELVWLLGRWKSPQLNTFIDKFSPDIIFMPVFQSRYAHRLLWYVQKRTNAKVVLFHEDDYVTRHQFSFSPLYWINRYLGRRAIMKSVKIASINYCISQIQKDEYEKILKTTCKILYKGGNFSEGVRVKSQIGKPIKLVYAGNIYAGRYKSLSIIGEVLDQINQNDIKAILHIYSHTPLSNEMKTALLNKRSIEFHGGVSSSEIKGILDNADILVHAESFQLKERLMVRQSFSTKIVDYFQVARCIFAVGWKEAASIDYLIKNDAAIVACNEKEIEEKLRRLLEHPEQITEYGKKGWECGKRNHQIAKIQDNLYNDLLELNNKYSVLAKVD